MEESSSLTIAIDGPGVEPSTIDPQVTLEFAAAYVALLRSVAKTSHLVLGFSGIDVKCGSFRLVVGVDNEALGLHVAKLAEAYVSAPFVPAPRGVARSVRRVRKAVDAMPKEYRLVVHIGQETLPVRREAFEVRSEAWEVTTLRAVPRVVGGRRMQICQFTARSEEGGFTLQVENEDMARRLGSLLHREVEIDVRIKRDALDRIERGTLLELHELVVGAPVAAFDAWFRTNCSGWENVEDINKELGRD